MDKCGRIWTSMLRCNLLSHFMQFQLFIWFRDLKFSARPFHDRAVIDYLAVLSSLVYQPDGPLLMFF